MAGHSKWSKVKRIKGLLDVKRGAALSKLVKEITVAARLGGDPSGNPRQRSVVETARAANLPKNKNRTAAQILHLHETLEDNDDPQNVYSNFDISEEVLVRLSA